MSPQELSENTDPEILAGNINRAYPRQDGEELPIRLATGQVNVLVIDDELNEDKHKEKLETLQERFCSAVNSESRAESENHENVFKLHAPAGLSNCASAEAVAEWLAEKNRIDPYWLRRFDLILLDLCLGEEHGEEPRGYQFLGELRRFFPYVPIVVYTKYEDMGHIEEAFRRGATWYLRKSEADKLAAHFLHLIDNPKWEREWASVRKSIQFDTSDPNLAAPADRYLIWKLLEHVPGTSIAVRRLTGGIGGALTVWTSRRVRQSYHCVSPVVVKIGDAFEMSMERIRYLRFIAPYLGNRVGRIERPLERGEGDRAAIAYTYTGITKGHGTRVASLKDVLTENLKGLDACIYPFSDYRKLFDRLYDQVLQHIHTIDPQTETRSEADFPNTIFDESEIAVNAYLARLMPERRLDLEGPLKDVESADKDYFEDVGDKNTLRVIVVDRDEKRIQALAMGSDRLMHRIDLEGTLGGFYGAVGRHLRIRQPVGVDVSGESKDVNTETEAWAELWSYQEAKKDAVNLWKQCNYNGHAHESEAVVALRKWLVQNGRPVLQDGIVGIIHGDMNMGNVMVEQVNSQPKLASAEPWMIDFARTKRDRIVYDFTQFEQDVFYSLLRPKFFSEEDSAGSLWKQVDELLLVLTEAAWQLPPVAQRSPKLKFLLEIVQLNREMADRAGVGSLEYQFSLGLQFLLVHKIAAQGRLKALKDC